MAGFDFAAGRSNGMVAAEARGMLTAGRWAKGHGVSARAAVAVMCPTEAHHTGTGRRGKSRLTPVIDSAMAPTSEQLAAMRRSNAGEDAVLTGCSCRWVTFVPVGRHGDKRIVEHMIHGATVRLVSIGKIETINDEKILGRSGVVVVRDEHLVAQSCVDPFYDDVRDITRRLVAEQPAAGSAGAR